MNLRQTPINLLGLNPSLRIKVILIQSQQKKLGLISSLLKCQNDFCIAGIGRDSYSALRLTETQRPDAAVVIDYHLDKLSGVELIPLIKRRSSATMVVLFSTRGMGRVRSEEYWVPSILTGICNT